VAGSFDLPHCFLWGKMKPTISDLINWSRNAGRLLREGYGKSHSIDYKGRIDLVTEMDRMSENYLVEQIQHHFPDHTIFAEESGQISGKRGACWYIDPLDGTTNYAHHMPNFAVSVAYVEDDVLALGVVYDPMRDECFSAMRGQGAYLNGERIRVSNAQELISCLLVTGFPYDHTAAEKNLANFAHFTRLSQGVRRLGSAAIDLCYIAAGRLDGYWEVTLQPYDLAAGALIVREAGGKVSSMQGNENLFLAPYSIAAANPVMHALLLEEFQKVKA
jgi:myo-inositol-1(or 4)-monophosphatase